MAPNAKRVFYVKYLSGPVFAQILAKRPDIQLDKLENETPDAEATPVLGQAHAYQIGASRQVIGKHLQVTDALLAKTPNLVAVSSNGAGYDTIDVDSCTRAGIIVVTAAGCGFASVLIKLLTSQWGQDLIKTLFELVLKVLGI